MENNCVTAQAKSNGDAIATTDQEKDQPLMTVKAVAAYLGVTQRTVYRLMKEYQLPACKVGGQWRFKVEGVEAWMRREKNAAAG